MQQRISWRLLVFAALIGIVVGGGYYLVMRERSRATPFVPFISSPIEVLPTSQPTPVPLNADYPRVSIPTAGVSALIVQLPIVGNTWDIYGLGRNAGHLIGTSPLMGTGNTVLVGHVEMADGSPGIFASIQNMRVGEPIILNWHGEQREYGVTAIRTVSPDDVSVLYPTDHEQLTLITCSDYDFFSNTYLQRVVLVATRAA
jgi:LPXTG-site transpeptidase (sortase) family protein